MFEFREFIEADEGQKAELAADPVQAAEVQQRYARLQPHMREIMYAAWDGPEAVDNILTELGATREDFVAARDVERASEQAFTRPIEDRAAAYAAWDYVDPPKQQ